MTAAQLVATLQARGVELVPVGSRLRFRPGEAVTPEEREALRRYKAEVLALLSRPPSPWPDVLPELGRKVVGPFGRCGLCPAGTFVQYGSARRCLDCARAPGSAVIRLFRAACEGFWSLTAQGPEADRADIAETWARCVKFQDEVGEPMATALRRGWAREWWRVTRFCPWCGQRARPDERYHDPAADGA
jgi:hypothetical protein